MVIEKTSVRFVLQLEGFETNINARLFALNRVSKQRTYHILCLIKQLTYGRLNWVRLVRRNTIIYVWQCCLKIQLFGVFSPPQLAK